jgi:hypothetical protein
VKLLAKLFYRSNGLPKSLLGWGTNWLSRYKAFGQRSA